MGLDINKIINESIQETLNDAQDEKTDEKIIEDDTSLAEGGEENPFANLQHAIVPAISAGLGALALRNKLRTI